MRDSHAPRRSREFCLGDQFRATVAHFPSQHARVSARVDERTVTTEVDGLVPVSFEPPLMLVSVDRTSAAAAAIDRAGAFEIEIDDDAADLLPRMRCEVTERMTSASHLVFIGLVTRAEAITAEPAGRIPATVVSLAA